MQQQQQQQPLAVHRIQLGPDHMLEVTYRLITRNSQQQQQQQQSWGGGGVSGLGWGYGYSSSGGKNPFEK
jgi:hypothetical protein